jgi:hypothetical protein
LSFIAELPSLLDGPGDRTDPRAKIDVSFQSFFQHPPERGLYLDIVAVDRHVDIRVRTKLPRLKERTEEVDGLNGREQRSRTAYRVPHPLQHSQTKRLPLLSQLAVAADVVLAKGAEGGFVHRSQCTALSSLADHSRHE